MKTMLAYNSLPVVIDAKMLPIKKWDEDIIIVGRNINVFGRHAARMVRSGQWPNADTYVLLGTLNDRLKGIANGGWELDEGVCSTRIEKRVSINWYETTEEYSDDLLTALVMLVGCCFIFFN